MRTSYLTFWHAAVNAASLTCNRMPEQKFEDGENVGSVGKNMYNQKLKFRSGQGQLEPRLYFRCLSCCRQADKYLLFFLSFLARATFARASVFEGIVLEDRQLIPSALLGQGSRLTDIAILAFLLCPGWPRFRAGTTCWFWDCL